jgi:hypothetical protein
MPGIEVLYYYFWRGERFLQIPLTSQVYIFIL